jgi:hypothetical protein
MRRIACVLLGLLLSVCCAKASAAEESRFRLWPFGRDRANNRELTGNSLSPLPSATATPNSAAAMPFQTATGSLSTEAMPEQRWMLKSPLARVSWPRIHMPEFSMRPPKLPRPNLPRPQWPSTESQVDDTRNTWMHDGPEPARPTPLRAMQQGAQRVGQGTRTAWRKTVDALTPGEAATAADPRVAARDEKPPFWKRLGSTEQPKKPGSQTVTEMLSQERIDF